MNNNCGYIEDYIKEGVIDGRLMDIIDGDTIICILGIIIGESETFLKFKCRLNGIDTYEMRSKDPELHQLAINGRNFVVNRLVGQGSFNLESRKELRDYLEEHITILKIRCYKLDKYGRLLIDVILNENVTLTEELIKNKFGYSYDGGHKKMLVN
jgi:endonuclease YncB( thermonuclease family)